MGHLFRNGVCDYFRGGKLSLNSTGEGKIYFRTQFSTFSVLSQCNVYVNILDLGIYFSAHMTPGGGGVEHC